MNGKLKVRRSGRVLSASNKALLEKAIGHLQASIDIIQAVIDSDGEQTAIENSWRHAPMH